MKLKFTITGFSTGYFENRYNTFNGESEIKFENDKIVMLENGLKFLKEDGKGIVKQNRDIVHAIAHEQNLPIFGRYAFLTQESIEVINFDKNSKYLIQSGDKEEFQVKLKKPVLLDGEHVRVLITDLGKGFIKDKYTKEETFTDALSVYSEKNFKEQEHLESHDDVCNGMFFVVWASLPS